MPRANSCVERLQPGRVKMILSKLHMLNQDGEWDRGSIDGRDRCDRTGQWLLPVGWTSEYFLDDPDDDGLPEIWRYCARRDFRYPVDPSRGWRLDVGGASLDVTSFSVRGVAAEATAEPPSERPRRLVWEETGRIELPLAHPDPRQDDGRIVVPARLLPEEDRSVEGPLPDAVCDSHDARWDLLDAAKDLLRPGEGTVGEGDEARVVLFDVDADNGEDAWEVLAAWYFQLPGAHIKQFEAIRRAWLEIYETVHDDAPGLGVVPVLYLGRDLDEREPLATVAWHRQYASTWMGHQMGIVPRLRQDRSLKAVNHIAKAGLYQRSIQVIRGDPEARWLAGACIFGPRWMQFKWDFSASRAGSWDGRDTCVVPLRAYEIEAMVEPRKEQLSHDVLRLDHPSIDDTRREELLATVLEAIADQRPFAYREALDLVEGRYDLGLACERIRQRLPDGWVPPGGRPSDPLMRRTTFLAWKPGEGPLRDPLAVAIHDEGLVGLNAWGVFSVVRLFPLAEIDPLALERVAHALLWTAHQRAHAEWMAAGGPGGGSRRRHPFLTYEAEYPGPCSHPSRLDGLPCMSMGLGHFWIIASHLAPDFLDYCCEATGTGPLREHRSGSAGRSEESSSGIGCR